MESFETLYETKQQLIKGALRYLKVYRNYEDYYQIGAYALYEATLNFDEAKGNFDSYAYSMIIGRIKSAITKANRYDSRTFAIEPSDFSQYEAKLTTHQTFEALHFESYTAHLTKKQADVITERFLYHHDIKTTAKNLGITEHVVKNQTREALKRLRARL